MPTTEPFNMEHVERLRNHMLLSVPQFCQLIGVSKMTYSRWLRGAVPRKDVNDKLRRAMRKLLVVVQEEQYPTPEVHRMSRGERFNNLLELLKKHH